MAEDASSTRSSVDGMRSAEETIAYALEIDPVLQPCVPELLEDLEQLKPHGSHEGIDVRDLLIGSICPESANMNSCRR